MRTRPRMPRLRPRRPWVLAGASSTGRWARLSRRCRWGRRSTCCFGGVATVALIRTPPASSEPAAARRRPMHRAYGCARRARSSGPLEAGQVGPLVEAGLGVLQQLVLPPELLQLGDDRLAALVEAGVVLRPHHPDGAAAGPVDELAGVGLRILVLDAVEVVDPLDPAGGDALVAARVGDL